MREWRIEYKLIDECWMESWILNNALNVEYKLNIKRIVEYVIQNYI